MYVFYNQNGHEILTYEHYLYAGEIAILYKCYTKDGKPHSVLVSALINDINDLHNDKNKFYYKSSKEKLWRVYSPIQYCRIHDRMQEILKNGEYKSLLRNKTYTCQRR